jgi:hypothetical protein
VGGLLQRRRLGGPDAGAFPQQRFFYSRELREMLLETEELTARCTGPVAAAGLMDIYAARYHDGEAPMRDKGRDRKRMVEACGGNPERFDQDEPQTWGSTLGAAERMAIAERLLPYLHGGENDRRQIARNGLMVCLPRSTGRPDWDASRAEWERWFSANR